MRGRNDPAVPTEQFEVGKTGSEAAGAVQEQHRRPLAILPNIEVNSGYRAHSHVHFLPLQATLADLFRCVMRLPYCRTAPATAPIADHTDVLRCQRGKFLDVGAPDGTMALPHGSQAVVCQ